MELRDAPHSPQQRGARTRAPQPQQLMSPCLPGKYHLSADMTLGAKRLTLVLSTQRAEVDTAGATAPLGVLPVPRQVVVARLLVAVRNGRRLPLVVSATCPQLVQPTGDGDHAGNRGSVPRRSSVKGGLSPAPSSANSSLLTANLSSPRLCPATLPPLARPDHLRPDAGEGNPGAP